MSKRSIAEPASAPSIGRSYSDQSGSITTIFGLSSLILFATVGGAIDFASWYHAKSQMQGAIDSAALAGGRALQVAETNDPNIAVQAAQNYFEQMKPSLSGVASPTFTVLENGTVVRGTINLSVPSLFLKMVGISSMQSTLVTETVIAAGANAGTSLEISLMLDTTGSMSGQKIEDLKLAAKDLVDIVVWADQSQYYSKVALAPFSQRVNVGSYIDKVTDLHASKSFSGTTLNAITCVTERTGTEQFTDAKPVGLNALPAYQGDTGTTARDNQSNYSATGTCRTTGWGSTEIPQIMPLTSDKAAVKSAIDALPANGSTAGSLGTAWAWYLLSPLWDGIWQGESMPAPYSDITTLGPKGKPKLMKVAVLMTDGAYNTAIGQNYGDNSSEAQTISDNAVTLCTNMKAAGIKVFTVGFALEGNAMAINTLKSCATAEAGDPPDSPSNFFNTATGSELRGAFRQIALQLSTLRIRL